MPTTAAPICRIDLQHMQICTTSAAWSALDLIMPRTRELRSAIHPDDRDEFASFLNNAPMCPPNNRHAPSFACTAPQAGEPPKSPPYDSKASPTPPKS